MGKTAPVRELMRPDKADPDNASRARIALQGSLIAPNWDFATEEDFLSTKSSWKSIPKCLKRLSRINRKATLTTTPPKIARSYATTRTTTGESL